jgi:hypothetical protein
MVPILLHFNKLEHALRKLVPTMLMKPKHLFHEIDKIFFFLRGLDSPQSRGNFSTLQDSVLRPLFQRFDTLASTVRIASSGDTQRPLRTLRETSELLFGTVLKAALFGWPCPQLLRRRRARERDLTAFLSLLERRGSSEPLATATPLAQASQHSARSAGSRSTIARVTNQCRK